MTCVIVAGLVRHSLTDYGDCLLINQKRFTILIQRLTCYSETRTHSPGIYRINCLVTEEVNCSQIQVSFHRMQVLYLQCNVERSASWTSCTFVVQSLYGSHKISTKPCENVAVFLATCSDFVDDKLLQCILCMMGCCIGFGSGTLLLGLRKITIN